MTAAGGIGIAKMISKQLHKTEDARVAAQSHPIHGNSSSNAVLPCEVTARGVGVPASTFPVETARNR